VAKYDPIENITDSDWDLQIAVMLSASFHLIKRCLPAMKKKGKITSNALESLCMITQQCTNNSTVEKKMLITTRGSTANKR